jgi:hypothetical protein
LHRVCNYLNIDTKLGGSQMNRRSTMPGHLALAIALLCFTAYLSGPSPAAGGPAIADGTQVASDVVSGGGGESQSSSYKIHDTFGQGPIGPEATSSSYSFRDGFWATVVSGAGGAIPADTLPPDPVADFEALPLDGGILLSWTNPSDGDFVGTLIRYSTSDFPDTVTSGSVVGPMSGRFYNDPGTEDQYSHTGLTNTTKYYYTAWAFDADMNYAKGVRDSATPFDGVPPGQALFEVPTEGDEQITLRWTNPSDTDFDHSLLIYNTTDYPTGPEDGTPVENGADGKFPNSPASADSFVHTGLTNGTTYYYGVYAGDEVPNYGPGSTVSGFPQDTEAPAAIVSFTAAARADGTIKLEWHTPDDADYDGALVRYSRDTFPTTIAEGAAVENGNGGMFDGNPAEVDSFIHSGLASDTTYFYAIFAYDEVPNYSAPLIASARPSDTTDPILSLSVFQNPYLTSYLDIFMVSSEALIDTSIHCEVGGEEVDMDMIDSDEYVWMADYELDSTGPLSMSARARDLNLNWAEVSRTFSSSLVLAAGGGVAGSVDGRCLLSFPGRTVMRDSYILIFDDPKADKETGSAYDVSPSGISLDGFIEISIAYPDNVTEPQHLCMARFGGGAPKPLECYLDSEKGRLVAFVDKLGLFGLIRRPGVETPVYGEGRLHVLQNVPNPFVGTTDIELEVPRAGTVRADVITIDGRLVKTIADQYFIPGRHNYEWDGCDAAGHRVASGVYFYRVSYESETVTKKMVHLR